MVKKKSTLLSVVPDQIDKALHAVPEQFSKAIAAMQGVIASLNHRLERLERRPAVRKLATPKPAKRKAVKAKSRPKMKMNRARA